MSMFFYLTYKRNSIKIVSGNGTHVDDYDPHVDDRKSEIEVAKKRAVKCKKKRRKKTLARLRSK